MPAVNEASAETPAAFGKLVEMDPCSVLVKPGCDLVFGFLDGYPVHVIDFFAGLVVGKPMCAPRQHIVVVRRVDPGTGGAEPGWFHVLEKLRHLFTWRRCGLIALANHHPPHELDNAISRVIEAARAYIDDARFLVGILFQSDDLGNRAECRARIDRLEKPAFGVAKIGDRIERDIRYGLAEYDVKDEQVVDRGPWISDRLGEDIRRLHGKS